MRNCVTSALALGLAAFCQSAHGFDPLVTHFGLGHLMHPIQKPVCDGNCPCCKDHVYIFGVNGLNPLCTGNFNGLCDYLRSRGYVNTYFGQLHTSHGFCSKVRAIRAHDPDATIVLMGFSLGCNYVRCIANCLRREAIEVDLLVYLAGDMIFNTPRSSPDNTMRVVNVGAHGLILLGGDLLFHGTELAGARNEHLNTRHILVPSRHETVRIILNELCAATRVAHPGLCCLPNVPNRPHELPTRIPGFATFGPSLSALDELPVPEPIPALVAIAEPAVQLGEPTQTPPLPTAGIR